MGLEQAPSIERVPSLRMILLENMRFLLSSPRKEGEERHQLLTNNWPEVVQEELESISEI